MRQVGYAAAAVLLGGCAVFHPRTQIESLTVLSATYCSTPDAIPDADGLAAAHCADQGLIAKRVTDNGRCMLTAIEVGRHFSYECVRKP